MSNQHLLSPPRRANADEQTGHEQALVHMTASAYKLESPRSGGYGKVVLLQVLAKQIQEETPWQCHRRKQLPCTSLRSSREEAKSVAHVSCSPKSSRIVSYFGAVLCCFSSISFSPRSVLVSWWGSLRGSWHYFLGIKMTVKRFKKKMGRD